MDNSEALDIDLPPSCSYLTALLNKIQPQTLSTKALLTSSYYIPTASDYSTVQDLISSSESSIRILEAELAKFQAVTNLLESRIANIRAYKEIQESLLLSPRAIRKLPDELLSEIFTDVCEGEGVRVSKISGQIWDLQQVCLRWRNVVQSTPLLWNNFIVEGAVEVKPSTVELRTRACLEFSRTSPLTIAIESGSRIRSRCQPLPPRIIEDIAKHADRWTSLSIREVVFHKALKETAAEDLIQQRGLSQLRTLDIANWNYCKFPYNIFRGAPVLEDITIQDVCGDP
ncbi:hypothetical protein BDQ17DRAFT_675570 [Cyathus striatus]|nr:hypothetical protein BDQ17DRAFT_675570 [Cyathus striatus]